MQPVNYLITATKIIRRYISSKTVENIGMRSKLRSLLKPIPIGVGVSILTVLRWQYNRNKEEACPAKTWQVTCYRAIPLRSLSRMWGWMMNKELPASLRPWFFSAYASVFGCNLEEAINEDLRSYATFAEFFCRQLKEGVRPIDAAYVVSPADGRVMNIGKVESCHVEQVKGITYSLTDFLGEPSWTKGRNELSSSVMDSGDYCRSLCENENTVLHQCVIYLAPGDYHRFHSPVDWTVCFRRHFKGELLSVNPKVAKWVPNLFSLNERAVYVGRWKHGFFSMTAVGATNVGSIHVYFDPNLVTNKGKKKGAKTNDQHFNFDQKVSLQKGEPFGEFRLGSTIVLIFEAPADFQFQTATGERTFVGKALSDT
ncbi:phosphatidylserine decarboxylase proenzyme, mitochondrial isoform X2 [Bacillus rossius redtenbacheri]